MKTYSDFGDLYSYLMLSVLAITYINILSPKPWQIFKKSISYLVQVGELEVCFVEQ